MSELCGTGGNLTAGRAAVDSPRRRAGPTCRTRRLRVHKRVRQPRPAAAPTFAGLKAPPRPRREPGSDCQDLANGADDADDEKGLELQTAAIKVGEDGAHDLHDDDREKHAVHGCSGG
jgi:hypothetical protein